MINDLTWQPFSRLIFFSRLQLIGSLLAIAVSLSSCSGDNVFTSQLTAENARLSSENAQLKEQIQQLQSKLAQVPSTPQSQTKADSADGQSAPANAGGAPPFKDISGCFGENEIKDLVTIGVLDATEPNFNPTKPATRAEFVSWLVRSNNKLRPKERLIRPADPGSPSSFTDLTESNPYFKYIQGMADAGWSVGFPDKTFRPDAILTREQMIGIKTPVDTSDNNHNCDNDVHNWTDSAKISKNFIQPMGIEAFSFYVQRLPNNWSRIYGNTKICQPQKPVTRAEAAMCVWAIGLDRYGGMITANKVSNKPTAP